MKGFWSGRSKYLCLAVKKHKKQIHTSTDMLPNKKRNTEITTADKVYRPHDIQLGPLCCGTTGGEGGGKFSDLDDLRQVEEHYTEVRLSSVDFWHCSKWAHSQTPCLQSVQMHVLPRGDRSDDKNQDAEVPLPRRGVVSNSHWNYQNWGKTTVQFEPGEVITEMHYFKGEGYSVGVKFVTSLKESDWIGMEPSSKNMLKNVKRVETPSDQQIVGFHGRIGAIIDAIGPIYQPRISFMDLVAAFQDAVVEPLKIGIPNDVLAIVLLYVKKDVYNLDLRVRATSMKKNNR